MATETRPRSVSRSFSDEEWESQRQRFYHYYIEKGLSLKDAAQCMKDNHGFDATPRQWERRIAPDKWGFQKYESRDTRLQAIQASGKSLLEVSTRGRRKSIASDGRSGLNEDRNMRRFARREVSRESRKRAKSVGDSDISDQESSAGSMPGTPQPPHISIQQIGDQFGQTQLTNNLQIPNWDPTVPGGGMNPHMFNQQSQMNGAMVPQIFVSHDTSQMNPMSTTIDSFVVDPENTMLNFNPHELSNQFPGVENPLQAGTDEFGNPILDQGITSFASPWNENYDMAKTPGNTQTSIDEGLGYDEERVTDSFTDMMSVDPMAGPSNTAMQGDGFEGVNHDFGFSNTTTRNIMPERGSLDIDPFDDPIHADVHTLLKASARTVDDLVENCMHECQNAPNLGTVLQSLKMLKLSLQAQNEGSNREIRMTLKNVASTQRRANQSVKDLCTNLRKKNETLKTQNETLMNVIQSSNPQASFSPSHQVQNPWQM